VHDQIVVNNRVVNPMIHKLPRGRLLESTALASFERERYDTAMNRQPRRVAETGAPARR
jgi:hypothetical protein